mgnify:CR=1 FL=1
MSNTGKIEPADGLLRWSRTKGSRQLDFEAYTDAAQKILNNMVIQDDFYNKILHYQLSEITVRLTENSKALGFTQCRISLSVDDMRDLLSWIQTNINLAT